MARLYTTLTAVYAGFEWLAPYHSVIGDMLSG